MIKQTGIDARWQRIIEIYQSNPGTFLERMNPQFIELNENLDSLTLLFQTEPWMRNPQGIVHGGIIATMADITMGVLARFITQDMMPTIQINISYLRGTPVHEDIYVKSACNKKGRQIVFLSCKGFMVSTPEKPLFTAEGSFFKA